MIGQSSLRPGGLASSGLRAAGVLGGRLILSTRSPFDKRPAGNSDFGSAPRHLDIEPISLASAAHLLVSGTGTRSCRYRWADLRVEPTLRRASSERCNASASMLLAPLQNRSTRKSNGAARAIGITLARTSLSTMVPPRWFAERMLSTKNRVSRAALARRREQGSLEGIGKRLEPQGIARDEHPPGH